MIKISEFNRPYDYSNDIALLQLDSPVEFNEKLSPLCIPDEDVCFKEGKYILKHFENDLKWLIESLAGNFNLF